jgi:NAD+ synthase (glutamine-hydrolysing)
MTVTGPGGGVLRVALAQLTVRVGDFDGTTEAVRAAMTWAGSVQADVLLTPEMTVSGYPAEDLLADPGFRAAAGQSVQSLAGAAGATVALVGAPLPTGSLPAAGGTAAIAPEGTALDTLGRPLRNVAAVLHRGRFVAAHAKTLLPTYSVFDDSRHFGPGSRRQQLFQVETSTGPVTFAVLICEDIWHPRLAVEAAAAGAQLILVLNASPYHVGKPALREQVVTEAAVRAGVPIAFVNSVGGQDDVVFDGGSFVVGADGALLARAAAFRAGQLVVDVPVASGPPVALTTGPNQLGPDGVGPDGVVALGATHRYRDPVPAPGIAAALPPPEEVYTALVTGVRDYCTRIGLSRILIAVSCGIDSALAATIAVDAVGADQVWAVGMPGPYSSAGALTDARALAAALGIRFDVVPIADPYAERADVLARLLADRGEAVADVAWENLQARLRGVTVMTLANATGALVMSTGNRSESAVGYFTLYGDSCGTAPNPLGDLLKSDQVLGDGTVLPGVYGLARWRNEQAVAAGRPAPIPEATLTKPPSAELAEGQEDTDALPPYPVLDRLLIAFLEERRSADELVLRLIGDGYAPDEAATVVGRVCGLVDRAEFKRRQVPLRIKVSRLAFGRDRRLPLATAFGHRPSARPGPAADDPGASGGEAGSGSGLPRTIVRLTPWRD